MVIISSEKDFTAREAMVVTVGAMVGTEATEAIKVCCIFS